MQVVNMLKNIPVQEQPPNSWALNAHFTNSEASNLSNAFVTWGKKLAEFSVNKSGSIPNLFANDVFKAFCQSYTAFG